MKKGRLVAAGYAGYEGTGILAQAKEERLLRSLPRWLVENAAAFGEDAGRIREQAERIAGQYAMSFVSMAGSRRITGNEKTAGEMSGDLTHSYHMVHCAGDGGVLAALWLFAETCGLGMEIDLRLIPIRQETVEISEILQVNPYQMYAGGCVLAGTEDPFGLIRALEEAGIAAAQIGEIFPGSVRRIHNGETLGYLNIPRRIEQMREGTRQALWSLPEM